MPASLIIDKFKRSPKFSRKDLPLVVIIDAVFQIVSVPDIKLLILNAFQNIHVKHKLFHRASNITGDADCSPPHLRNNSEFLVGWKCGCKFVSHRGGPH